MNTDNGEKTLSDWSYPMLRPNRYSTSRYRSTLGKMFFDGHIPETGVVGEIIVPQTVRKEADSPITNQLKWSSIWSSAVWSKVKAFMWRLVSNVVPI